MKKHADIDLERDYAMVKTALDTAHIEHLKKLIYPLLGAAGVTGLASLYGYTQGKADREQHQKDLSASLASTFQKDKSFLKDPQTFAARFSELSAVSPSIAKNPAMAAKLLKPRMSSGLSLDDVHKLSVIEQASLSSRRAVPSASASARGAAATAADRLLGLFGPSYVRHAGTVLEESRAATEKTKKDLAADRAASEELAAAKLDAQAALDDPQAAVMKMLAAMRKQGSAYPARFEDVKLNVSEGQLGRMISDRYTMLKQANISRAFDKGSRALANHIAYIAPALALGGGLGLAKLVADHIQDAQLSSQAEDNFKSLMRKSDVVKQDPAVAREAFESLRMFAPMLASRPNVLKTFVEAQVNTGGFLPLDQVKMIADAGGAAERPRPDRGFQSGMKSVMDALHLPIVEKKNKKERV